MSIKDIYNESKNKFLFNDSKNFAILRSNILKNLDITPKIKKNNESLKYLDPQVLNFLYKYTKSSNDISHLDHKVDIINIDSVDGKISTIYKKTNDKINIDIILVFSLERGVHDICIYTYIYIYSILS